MTVFITFLILYSLMSNYAFMFYITEFKVMTNGDFTVQMLPGSHFYLKVKANEKVLLDHIMKHLETAEMDYL